MINQVSVYRQPPVLSGCRQVKTIKKAASYI
ncbi:TPA: hypothetical protein ACG7N0_002091 [Escherichia coli]|nr:hypothetical protein [Escherichia coli]EGH1304906.1 hypothetical protein [Escherichia coli]EGH1387298.1 hypothetical protein [Escherichia coli]EHB6887448.1 hypothetical protein [Escherichia coli]EHB6955795.1 hypothetical protein [Escherichia coli]EIY4306986.1 hypothetical protein [Escherichia coli]